MKQREFAQLAIKNGYTGDSCNGWNWIKENISELDWIFKTEQYKDCNRFKSECMSVLLGIDNAHAIAYTELEEDALTTAWFLNNDRVYKAEKARKIAELKENGFVPIKNDMKLDGRRIKFIVDTSGEMFGGQSKYEGKLKWSIVDKRLMAMQKKHRRRGFWVDDCSRCIYVKIIKKIK